MRKLFFNTKMTWPRVIIFAVISAILAALLLTLPFTKDTSLANVGVTFEFWILAAIFIATNCERPLEAALKIFVFFLVSQPLIYLLQVPFSPLGWELFEYYPRWFIWTVLCLPGGFIAWFVRKDRFYSALILTVATAFLGCEAAWFIRYSCIPHFPSQLIAAVFCIACAAALPVIILKKHRVLCLILTAVISIGFFCGLWFASPRSAGATYALESGHVWELDETSGDYVGDITVDGSTVKVNATAYGTNSVSFINENGDVVTVVISYGENGVTFTEKQ